MPTMTTRSPREEARMERPERLTGRSRYRMGREHVAVFTRRNVLIGQVEEIYSRFRADIGVWREHVRWRDMQAQDLPLPTQIEIGPPPPPDDEDYSA